MIPALPTTLAFMDIGFAELVVVGFVALVLFGGRLPEVMRTFGRTYRSFRQGVEGLTREARDVIDVRTAKNAPYRPTPAPPLGSGPGPGPGPGPVPTIAPPPPPVSPPAPPSSGARARLDDLPPDV